MTKKQQSNQKKKKKKADTWGLTDIRRKLLGSRCGSGQANRKKKLLETVMVQGEDVMWNKHSMLLVKKENREWPWKSKIKSSIEGLENEVEYQNCHLNLS